MGVNNLAAKLLLALFPPGGAFFRLAIDDFILDTLKQGEDPQAVAEFEAALAKVERSVMKRFETSAARAVIAQALKHLIVTGNGLIEVLPKGRLKFHSLRSYVVKRDLEGTVVELIICERVTRETLDPDVLALLPQDGKDDEEIDLFTHIRRGPRKRWVRYQEVEGHEIAGTRGTYPLDKSPYIPLRFISVDGEDYGRGYVEEYLGDLASAESLNGSIVDYAAAAARILLLVDEAGMTSLADLERAPNGGIIYGRKKDVDAFSLEKYADFSVQKDVVARIEARLEQAFLRASSIQRQAERVTAEEIRIMAGELEQTLGGIYSVLAQELQLPLVSVLMTQLAKEGLLPALPEKSVTPQIVTGIEGLGRNTDLGRLQALAASCAQLGPTAAEQYLDVGAFLSQTATALSLDAKALVRSEREVQAAQQQQQQQALAEKMAPNAMAAGADAMAPQQPTT